MMVFMSAGMSFELNGKDGKNDIGVHSALKKGLLSSPGGDTSTSIVFDLGTRGVNLNLATCLGIFQFIVQSY